MENITLADFLHYASIMGSFPNADRLVVSGDFLNTMLKSQYVDPYLAMLSIQKELEDDQANVPVTADMVLFRDFLEYMGDTIEREKGCFCDIFKDLYVEYIQPYEQYVMPEQNAKLADLYDKSW